MLLTRKRKECLHLTSTKKEEAMLWMIIVLLQMGLVVPQTITSSNVLSSEAKILVADIDNQTTIAPAALPDSADFERELFKRCFDGLVPAANYSPECCRKQYLTYRNRWHMNGYYLTTNLERLQRWNCTEFEDECRTPSWPFTRFTKLIYNRFCDHDLLERQCTVTVREIVQRNGFIKPHADDVNRTETSWSVLIESLTSPQLEVRDLADPCIQVALFDRKDGGADRFFEIVTINFPFCGLQWAGYDYYSALYRGVSPWTGVSAWCQGSIIVSMIVMTFLCVATIVANATILGVFCTTAKLRNSQAIYKISLAVADLLVGVIVWPSMIIMQYLAFFKPRSIRPSSESNVSQHSFFPFDDMTPKHSVTDDDFVIILPRPFVLSSGFFTLLSFAISIYTVMWASFDRYWAIFRPLKYNRHIAKKHAKISCVVLWAVALVVAILPICVKDIEYIIITSALILPLDGEFAMAFISAALIFPLMISWVVTIRTLHASRVHTKARKQITSTSNALDRRLTKTLSLMVGIFTLCVFPAIICSAAGFVIPNIAWSNLKTVSVMNSKIYSTCEYATVILLTSNSLWNCFIYSVRTLEFRQAANSMFRTILQKTGMNQICQSASCYKTS